jgi:hypothetical protein
MKGGWYVKILALQEASIESLDGYANFIKSYIKPLTEDDNVWTSKQTYLAMGNLLNVAAELKIDVSLWKGLFLKSEWIVRIRKVRLYRFSFSTISYRHDEDATQYYKKLENHKKIYLSQYNY